MALLSATPDQVFPLIPAIAEKGSLTGRVVGVGFPGLSELFFRSL
jgi:hypothetical protein